MAYDTHTLQPAYRVIETLGGKSAVASALSLSPSTISRWCMPRPEGTGGTIPQKYWPALLGLARAGDLSLSVADLASFE
jgi:hypothetical protein